MVFGLVFSRPWDAANKMAASRQGQVRDDRGRGGGKGGYLLRRKLLSDSAATGVQQQSTIYIQDVSIRRSFSTGIQLT